MKKTNKKIIAILLVAIIVASFLPFKIFAENSYTITFSIAADQNGYHDSQTDTDVGHFMSIDNNNHFIIDGQYVEPKLASEPTTSVGYTIAQSGNNYVMTITNGEEVVLNFNTANNFQLFVEENSINVGTTFNHSAEVTIKDIQNVNPQQPTEGTSFEVKYKDNDNKTRGEVKFSIDNWTTPNTINNDETRIINIPNGRVFQVKVVPNPGYAVDWSGVELVINESRYSLNTQENAYIAGALSGENGYTIDVNQNNVTSIKIENLEFRQDQMNNFNGNVWFIWNDNGTLCRYLIEDVEPVRPLIPGNDEVIIYETKYVKASDVRDANHTLDLTKMHTDGPDAQYLFVNDEKINLIDGITTWEAMNNHLEEIFVDDPETEEIDEAYDGFKSFAYDPCGAVDGLTSISTNGDRGFRITIYNENQYFGLTNATTLNDVTYYPSFWDPMFFNPIKDIWGSTFENPAELETYIGEPNIKLDSDRIGGEIDNIEVASDINDDAVEITKTEDGKYTIKFNSNYYDKVIFKISSGTKKYYLRISRISLHASPNGIDLYVPVTDNNEYEVIATYYLKDGTEISTKLKSRAGDYGGKNLDIRFYQLPDEYKDKIDISPEAKNPPVRAYFTVVKSNSTPTIYKGTFSGSGKGTYYVIKHGSFVREFTK